MISIKDAYLIIANKNKDQLQKLIDMIDDSRNDIFLLIDKKSNLIDDKWHVDYSTLNQLDPINIYWGAYSQIDAELRLLHAAISTNHYSYYHLLSGQDLPLVNTDKMHDFFDNNQHHEFLQYQTENKRDINEKLNFHLFTKFYDAGIHTEHSQMNIILRLFFSIYRHIETLIVRHINESKIPINKVSTASTWMSIDDVLARLIVRKSKWIYDKFHRGKVIDELFIPTLINYYPNILNKINDLHEYKNSPNNPLSNLMYIVKSAESAHPKIFTYNDYDELHSAKNHGYLFARKFDSTVDNNIIKKIYNYVMKL